MKKPSLFKRLLSRYLTTVLFLSFTYPAIAQFGALKDKVKKSAENAKEKLPSASSPELPATGRIYKVGDRVRVQRDGYGGAWDWGTVKEETYKDHSEYKVEYDFEKGRASSESVSKLESKPLQDVLQLRYVKLFDKWFAELLEETGKKSEYDQSKIAEAQKQLQQIEELVRPGENPGITRYLEQRKQQFNELKAQQGKATATAEEAKDFGDLLKDAYFITLKLTPSFSVHFRKSESEEFLELAGKLGFPVLKDRIANSGNNAIKKDLHYEDVIVDFPASFEKYIRDYLVAEINRNIETAYTEKAEGASRAGAAFEAAQIAANQCNAALLVLPQHPELLKLQKQTSATLEKIGAETSSKLFTGDFHKEHQRSIVFSGSPVTPGKENPSALATAFKAGDPVYAAAYLKGTVKELLQSNGSVKIDIGIFLDSDGGFSQNALALYTYRLKEEETEKTAFELDILPALNAVRMPLAGEKFAKALGSCSPRPHKVTVVFYGVDGTSSQTLASGSFELDCSEGQEKLLALAPKYKAAANAGVALPKPVRTDAKLQAEMLSAAKDFLNGWRPGTPVKAIITSNGWDIVRHEITGVVLKRTTYGVVAVKHTDGTCKFYKARFAQQYVGGQYGKTVWDSRDDGTDIACENIR